MTNDRARNETGLSPFCRFLRSKKAFFASSPPRTVDDLLDASRHCWCGHTQHQVGPDEQLVEPEDCRAGRSCYEAY